MLQNVTTHLWQRRLDWQKKGLKRQEIIEKSRQLLAGMELEDWLISLLTIYPQSPAQDKFIESMARERWYISGNKSGKTFIFLWDIILRAIGQHPFDHCEVPNVQWIASPGYKHQREIVQPLMEAFGIRYMVHKPANISGIPGCWDFFDFREEWGGSHVVFKSADQGRKLFQGANVDLVGFDEEPPRDIYSESKMRTAVKRGRISCAMTPLEGMTWVCKEKWDPWQEKKISPHRVECFKSSIYDNKYLDSEMVEEILDSYNETERDARAYGNFVLLAGSAFFGATALRNAGAHVCTSQHYSITRETKQGGIVNGGVCATLDNGSPLQIWKLPQAGKKYFVGGDISEGHGGDNCVIEVVSEDMEQCAELIGQIPQDIYSELCVLIAKFYNGAKIAVECNYDNGATMKIILEDFHYHNVYFRQDWEGVENRQTMRPGWLTNKKTRPRLLLYLESLLRTDRLRVYSSAVFAELQHFIRNKLGKPCAQPGYHDDSVMSIAIACMVANPHAAYLPLTTENKEVIIKPVLDRTSTIAQAALKRAKDTGGRVRYEMEHFY